MCGTLSLLTFTVFLITSGQANAAEQMSQSNFDDGAAQLESCEAKLTKSLFTFHAEPRSGLYGARSGPAVISKRGEIYAVMSQAGRTGVYSYAKDKIQFFEEGNFEDVSDLFESRSGRVYFAYMTPKEIKVFDARTGTNVLTTAVASVEHVGDLVAQLNSETSLYRPLLFENAAGVQVAIVPRSDDLYLDEAFSVPLAVISLRNGDVQVSHALSGQVHYQRMQDGHVYGVGWTREMGGPANTLMLYDLNAQKTLLSEKFEHQQDPPIISAAINVFFKAPRQPELAIHLQSPTGKVMVYDREHRRFQPLSGLSRAKTVAIQFYNDHEGKPWFAAIEGSETAGLSPEFYSLVVQPLTSVTGGSVLDLDLSHPLNDIPALEVIERPEGPLFLAWERTLFEGKVRYARVQIFDPKRQQLVNVPIPNDWPGAIRKKTFWNPQRNSLVAYFLRDDGSTPEFATLLTPGG